MTAGCARCGSCCDPVLFDDTEYRLLRKWANGALDGVPDPSAGEGWAWWARNGWQESEREIAAHRYRPGSSYRQNADFITAHWHPLGDGEFRCDAFDPLHRICTAYGGRPPVCRDFPWYGQPPDPERDMSGLPHCSYLADISPAARPEGSRPLIPLSAIHRKEPVPDA